MTVPVRSAIKVTLHQLVMLATSANDRRVVTEAQQIALDCDVDPRQVYSYTYKPGRTPKMVFELFQADPQTGIRLAIHDDGTPYDPESGKTFHFLTTEKAVTWRGELPTWWDQAARQRKD